MNSQYVTPLPVDASGYPMQDYPSPKKALSRYTSENATASSVISLTHDTTSIEIAAIGGTASMRWVTTGDTQASIVTVAGSTSNFDHVIATGTMRRFVVPRESTPNPQSVQGVNRLNGLYQRVAYKTAGIASVMLGEF